MVIELYEICVQLVHTQENLEKNSNLKHNINNLNNNELLLQV